MAHWTPSGPRDSSKARRYNEKRAADAAAASSSASSSSSPYAVSDELRASRSAPVEPDAEGRLPLFRGGGVRAPPGTVEPATTLSSFYPAVALPPILARPLVKPGRPRSLGEFKTKAVKPRGRIEGARVDAQAYADRLPPHASALYTVAVRAGLADPARPARKMKNAAEGGDVAGGGAPSVERPVADALELADAVLQAITHPSFFESDAASAANARPAPSSPSDPAPLAPAEQRDNALLAASGRAVLELVLTEYHLKQFPNMPTPGLKRIVTALSNAGALADVGAEIGLGLVQKSPDHGQTDLVATGLPVRYRRHTWEVRAVPLSPSGSERGTLTPTASFPLLLVPPLAPGLRRRPGARARGHLVGRTSHHRPAVRARGPARRDALHPRPLSLARGRPVRPAPTRAAARRPPRGRRPLRARAPRPAHSRRERQAERDALLQRRVLLWRAQARRGRRHEPPDGPVPRACPVPSVKTQDPQTAAPRTLTDRLLCLPPPPPRPPPTRSTACTWPRARRPSSRSAPSPATRSLTRPTGPSSASTKKSRPPSARSSPSSSPPTGPSARSPSEGTRLSPWPTRARPRLRSSGRRSRGRRRSTAAG